jgi:PTS system nitrogen regulatory IIA component
MQLCCLPALIFLAFCLCGVVIRTRLEGAMKGSVMLKDLTFDLVLTDLKAQTQRKSLREIAGSLAGVSGLDPAVLARLFIYKEKRQRSAIGRGVAIVDLQSIRVVRPLLALAVLDHSVDFRAPDGRGVDLVAALLSPLKDGPVHLQKISGVSRLLRDDILCESLRMAKDPDAVRLLLMRPEQRLSAA